MDILHKEFLAYTKKKPSNKRCREDWSTHTLRQIHILLKSLIVFEVVNLKGANTTIITLRMQFYSCFFLICLLRWIAQINEFICGPLQRG